MISRGLTTNNDLILKNSRIAIVEDGAEVVQHVRTRLLFYLGEWFLDRDAGVPWFQQVFVKPADIANTESLIKAVILRTPGMLILTSFSLDFDRTTRRLSVEFRGETIYDTIIDETVELFING